MRTFNKKWTYEEKEDHIILRWRDYEVLIDHDDFHYFEENILKIMYNKRKYEINHAYLYIQHGSNYAHYKYETFHRVIMNCPRHLVVDHINGNSLDNRKSNLRICSQSENLANSSKGKNVTPTGSKYKGVLKVKNSELWRAAITCKGKNKTTYHKTEIEAAAGYNKMALELFGEFARLNEL